MIEPKLEVSNSLFYKINLIYATESGYGYTLHHQLFIGDA